MKKWLFLLSLCLPLHAAADAHCEGSTEELLQCQAPAIKQFLHGWVRAWADGDVETYLSYYSPDRSPRSGVSREEWEAQRRERIVPDQDVEIDLKLESMGVEDSGIFDVVFVQHYRAPHYQDQVRKRLFLVPENGDFRIFREQVIQ